MPGVPGWGVMSWVRLMTYNGSTGGQKKSTPASGKTPLDMPSVNSSIRMEASPQTASVMIQHLFTIGSGWCIHSNTFIPGGSVTCSISSCGIIISAVVFFNERNSPLHSGLHPIASMRHPRTAAEFCVPPSIPLGSQRGVPGAIPDNAILQPTTNPGNRQRWKTASEGSYINNSREVEVLCQSND